MRVLGWVNKRAERMEREAYVAHVDEGFVRLVTFFESVGDGFGRHDAILGSLFFCVSY